ncbi:hypothetical protein GTW45_18785, partial [Streptomyces sp. SID4940]
VSALSSANAAVTLFFVLKAATPCNRLPVRSDVGTLRTFTLEPGHFPSRAPAVRPVHEA